MLVKALLVFLIVAIVFTVVKHTFFDKENKKPTSGGGDGSNPSEPPVID